MEPESSLPHSQVPTICPYPEPARSSPCPHILLPEDASYYHRPICVWVSQVVCFPQVSPPKPWIRFSYPPHALHAPPISFSFSNYYCIFVLFHPADGPAWSKHVAGVNITFVVRDVMCIVYCRNGDCETRGVIWLTSCVNSIDVLRPLYACSGLAVCPSLALSDVTDHKVSGL
jgi:hypothetical protein